MLQAENPVLGISEDTPGKLLRAGGAGRMKRGARAEQKHTEGEVIAALCWLPGSFSAVPLKFGIGCDLVGHLLAPHGHHQGFPPGFLLEKAQ